MLNVLNILVIAVCIVGCSARTARHGPSCCSRVAACEATSGETTSGETRDGRTTESGGVSPGEIAVENPHMADMLLDLEFCKAEESRLAERLGDENEELIRLRQKIAVLTKRIQDFTEDWNRVRARTRSD